MQQESMIENVNAYDQHTRPGLGVTGSRRTVDELKRRSSLIPDYLALT